MNVTVIDNDNATQVAETHSTVSVIEAASTVRLDDTTMAVEVIESISSVFVIDVGYTVSVQSIGTGTVEVQTQGPKGDPASVETGPSFTYGGGVVSRIDYDSGNFKVFTYSGGNVTRIDYVQPTKTTRKDFSYNVDGTLAEITQTEI